MSKTNEQNDQSKDYRNDDYDWIGGGTGYTDKERKAHREHQRQTGQSDPTAAQRKAAGSGNTFKKVRTAEKIPYKKGDVVTLRSGEKVKLIEEFPKNETFTAQAADGKKFTVAYDDIAHKWKDAFKSTNKERYLGIYDQIRFKEPRDKTLKQQTAALLKYTEGGISVSRKGSKTDVAKLPEKPKNDDIWLPFKTHYANPETGKPYTADEIEKVKGQWVGGIYDGASGEMEWIPLSKKEIDQLEEQGVISPVHTKKDTEEKRRKAKLFIVIGHPSIIGSLPKAIGAHSILTKINSKAPTDISKEYEVDGEKSEMIVSDLAWAYSELVTESGFVGVPGGRVGYKDAALIAGWSDFLSSKKGKYAKYRFDKIVDMADFQKVDIIAITINDSEILDKEQKENLAEYNEYITGKVTKNIKYEVIDFAKKAQSNENLIKSEGTGANFFPSNQGLGWISDEIEKLAKKIDAKTEEGGEPSLDNATGDLAPKFTGKDLQKVWKGNSQIDKDGEMKALIIQKARQALKNGESTFSIKDPRADRNIEFEIKKVDGVDKISVV